MNTAAPVVSTALRLQSRLHGAVDGGLGPLDGALGEGADDLHDKLLGAAQVTPQVCLDNAGVQRVHCHTCT